jgi:hypothetical protein
MVVKKETGQQNKQENVSNSIINCHPERSEGSAVAGTVPDLRPNPRAPPLFSPASAANTAAQSYSDNRRG